MCEAVALTGLRARRYPWASSANNRRHSTLLRQLAARYINKRAKIGISCTLVPSARIVPRVPADNDHGLKRHSRDVFPESPHTEISRISARRAFAACRDARIMQPSSCVAL